MSPNNSVELRNARLFKALDTLWGIFLASVSDDVLDRYQYQLAEIEGVLDEAKGIGDRGNPRDVVYDMDEFWD